MTMAQMAAQMAQRIDLVDRARQHLGVRVADLELLLTSSPVVRPAGAAQKVEALPSPIVSVIVPTFNRAPLVTEAITSVQAQEFQDWELIVVDDGSTDNTASAIEPYLADKRIRYGAPEPVGRRRRPQPRHRARTGPFDRLSRQRQCLVPGLFVRRGRHAHNGPDH